MYSKKRAGGWGWKGERGWETGPHDLRRIEMWLKKWSAYEGGWYSTLTTSNLQSSCAVNHSQSCPCEIILDFLVVSSVESWVESWAEWEYSGSRMISRIRVVLMILLPFYWWYYSHSTDDTTPILLTILLPFYGSRIVSSMGVDWSR